MSKRSRNVLIAILIVAALLRFFGLGRGDTVNDEVLYAFRGLGMIDFDEAPYQTTPLEWFDPLAHPGAVTPWWVYVSFHDHPPLVFAVQHVFLAIFGDNTIAFRLPSSIAGVMSVYLLFLIGRKLFSEKAGLFSAFGYAITLNGVYISRTGLQEAHLIFFLLLAFYVFLQGLENKKYFIWLGVLIGLGGLVKYNFFIALPVFFAYLALFKRSVFRLREFWIGALLAIIVFSPVIVYNTELYRAVGHFDFQLSHMFGQEHPEWQVQPGKEIGTLGKRLTDILPRLIATHSWLFLALVAMSLAIFCYSFIKKPRAHLQEKTVVALTLAFLFVLIMLIGPAYRFLTMLTPFFALVVGFALAHMQEKIRGRVVYAVLSGAVIIACFEIFYSYNNQIAYYPTGPIPWMASKVRNENYNWGYNELEEYLTKEFAGKMPLLTFDTKYQFLENIRNGALQDGTHRGLRREPFLIVYGGNIDDGAKLWVFERRLVYKAWPILKMNDYYAYLNERGNDYFDRSGFKKQYFIYATNSVPDAVFRSTVAGLTPTPIKNQRGDIAFLVYKREL
ncbi:MAG: hypothetical protein A3I44_01870 [Candidatus Sungbacteria bacterium RIFCSPLOWO2_02_FULL_51_17]|nr:MAG: hypothetical protein A2676_04005 [Candidatus Sungbacteria bacterium RIFCSPHIGHO2_01_FULL_51_22]OHA05803.1 MAG: hypothetical protein A3B29_03230 [Candidatus Sungbacteria bacterium RIFCSPLOWO2_01_FULL_51_34]OHA11410.1 MAG: hypothetical protein A3I44_01870 [Candidatus Sungbacteria bacterium RIFCSPLOWO2_02_FULL_51_17]